MKRKGKKKPKMGTHKCRECKENSDKANVDSKRAKEKTKGLKI